MFKKKCNKLTAVLLVLIIAISLLPMSVFAAEDGAKLTILHMNDRHGRTAADACLSQMAKDLKAAGENVLVLDAGDSLHGQTVTNLAKGSAMVEIMNSVGYDAMTAGNHDFNFGLERMAGLAKTMNFPLLGANVIKADGSNLLESYKIFDMNGLKVGVFGISTPETVTKADPRIVAGLTFQDPAETASVIVAELEALNCDVIVALAHLGLDEATIPAHRSEALAAVDGIDVIIDGHSHTLLEKGKTVKNTLIAQTGEFAGNIGVVEITVSGDQVNKTARLIPVADNATLAADETIAAAIAAEEAKTKPITAAVVGSSPVVLEGSRNMVRTVETNLADVIADSMVWATGADLAFLTGGNIRASIGAGKITMGDVLTTLPFSNLLVTVELSGADILKVLEHGVDQHPNEAATRIHVSGINFTFDPAAKPGSRVVSATMKDGSALDPAATYTLSTSEFLAAGGDGYDTLANGKNLVYYGGDADALAGYIGTKPVFQAGPEGRVAEVLMAAVAESEVAVEAKVAVENKVAVEAEVAAETVVDTTAKAEAAKVAAEVKDTAGTSTEIENTASSDTVVGTEATVEAEIAAPVPAAGMTDISTIEPMPMPTVVPLIHIVQPGECLIKIANIYGTTWDELQKLNNITNEHLIYSGQELILPAA